MFRDFSLFNFTNIPMNYVIISEICSISLLSKSIPLRSEYTLRARGFKPKSSSSNSRKKVNETYVWCQLLLLTSRILIRLDRRPDSSWPEPSFIVSKIAFVALTTSWFLALGVDFPLWINPDSLNNLERVLKSTEEIEFINISWIFVSLSTS